mmetsp:Transcript_132069/g.313017  ORF Transcript_132069/g.313017 Transcript_132069/m.313017 type:complete len:243 (+) Transcript_132069:1151-1879(+)
MQDLFLHLVHLAKPRLCRFPKAPEVVVALDEGCKLLQPRFLVLLHVRHSREHACELFIVHFVISVVIQPLHELAHVLGFHGAGILSQQNKHLFLGQPGICIPVDLVEHGFHHTLFCYLLLQHDCGNKLGDIQVPISIPVQYLDHLRHMTCADTKLRCGRLQLCQGHHSVPVLIQLPKHLFQLGVGCVSKARVCQHSCHCLLAMVPLQEGVQLLDGDEAQFGVLGTEALLQEAEMKASTCWGS